MGVFFVYVNEWLGCIIEFKSDYFIGHFDLLLLEQEPNGMV